MNKSKLLQATTLAMFVFLLATFVAYKTGKLDNYFTDPNNVSDQVLNGENPNSPIVSLAANSTMSLPADSPPHHQNSANAPAKKDSFRVSPEMMSTSKSAVVIPQKEKFPVKKDSPVRTSPTMMYTSKSAVIFDQKLKFKPKDSAKYVKDTAYHLHK